MTFWAVGAAVAGPVISGMMASDSASDGLAAQEAGAARSDATQRYMYDTTRTDNAPTMQRGNAAGNRLGYLMGLGGGAGGASGFSGSSAPLSRESLRGELLSKYTTRSGGAGGGGLTPNELMMLGIPYDPNNLDLNSPVLGGENDSIIGYRTKQTPSSSVVDEAGLSADIERRMAEQQARQSAENTAASSDPAYGSLMRNFSEAAPEMRKFGEADWKNDFVAQNGIQFGLDEGRKGIERQQSASGSMLSGATLKALSRFGTDYGTKNTAGAYDRFRNEQDQGYGRYMDRRNWYKSDNDTTFNRLSTIAGAGQTATGQVGAAGQNYANRVSNTAEGMGNAAAAAGIAGSNAIGGGLQGAYNNYQDNRLIDRMRGGSGIRPQSVWGGGNAFSDTGDY